MRSRTGGRRPSRGEVDLERLVADLDRLVDRLAALVDLQADAARGSRRPPTGRSVPRGSPRSRPSAGRLGGVGRPITNAPTPFSSFWSPRWTETLLAAIAGDLAVVEVIGRGEQAVGAGVGALVEKKSPVIDAALPSPEPGPTPAPSTSTRTNGRPARSGRRATSTPACRRSRTCR